MGIQKNIEEGAVAGQVLFSGGIFIRGFFYTIIYLFVTFLAILLVADFEETIASWFIISDEKIEFIIHTIIASIPALLIISLKEWSIRRFRRKNNLPIYKNIALSLMEMELTEKAKLEDRAYKAAGVSSNIMNQDLEYWYGLKEKGIITEDEFDIKKKELLKA